MDVRRSEIAMRHAFDVVMCWARCLLATSLIVLLGCTRQAPDAGVSQLPVDDTTATVVAGEDDLGWQVSFIGEPPLTYPRDALNTFLTGADFTAELTFSEAVDAEAFERALESGVRGTGGSPVLTWESDRRALFDVRDCSGRVRLDFGPLARRAGKSRAIPLVIYCGPERNILEWSADRGTRRLGTVPAAVTPASTNADHAALFYHQMRAADGGIDVGIWIADFDSRSFRPLAVHYLGADPASAFVDGASAVVSSGGDDLQLFGTNGVRVRQFDPEDLGLVVGLEIDDVRGRIALFEGSMDASGRAGETRIRILDRGFDELARIEGAGRLSRLSGRWRTVDAVWLDSDTLAFIFWDNRFYGVVAVASVSTRKVTRTSVVADQLAGALLDGRFVVRRQAGGLAGCWRAEGADGAAATPLCLRLPGPSHAAVSPDGNLVALQLPDTGEVVVWNRVSGERRHIGAGEIAGWTPDGRLLWIAQPDAAVSEEPIL